MPTPLLPSLKANKVSIKTRGAWVAESQNTMTTLVDDLKVTVSSSTDISSIPDIWAHPKMYEDVLGNPNNFFHKEYVAKWRGILAIFALREARGIKSINVSKIHVPDASNLRDDDPKFLKVVSRLIPEGFEDENGKNSSLVQVITLKDKPLAFVWPGLLLCPAIGLEKIIVENISWWNDGVIEDPIPYLSDGEKVLLQNWIAHVMNDLPYNQNTLLSLLSEYQEDLNVENSGVRFNPGTSLGIEGPFKFIDYSLVPVLTDSVVTSSHVRLVNQKGTDEKTLLVITEEMDKQWGLPANKIVVAGNATFDSVANLCFGGEVLGSNKDLINGINIKSFNAELCSAGDFFTDKIGVCYVEKDMFPNAALSLAIRLDNTFARVILPIKEKLLKYLRADWLAEHVTIEVRAGADKQSGSDIEVKLELPLSGNDNETIVTLSKVYHRSDGEILDYDDMPLVQLWPNFITADPANWKAYYSFFDAPMGWQKNTFYVKPYWTNCKVVKINNNDTKKYAEVIRGEEFPEAYTCYSVEEKAAGNQNTEIGLILLDRPETLQMNSGNRTCSIGIDFGTTNSIAYYSINENQPELMRFESRLYSVIDPTLENKIELRRNFLSLLEQPNKERSSIRSIFHTYGADYNGDMDQPLVRGNIYYLEGCNTISEDEAMINSLRDDMKWSEDGTENMKGFLLQFCMQCMAEAIMKGATTIQWNYSYPSAFTKRQIDDMDSLWKTNVLPNLSSISKLSSRENERKTESAAMAEFFVKHSEAMLTRGIICFDIGGGSTDIAVWQGSAKSKMRYQCSLRFAGRKILNDYLFNKKEKDRSILPLLGSSDEEYNAQLQRVNEANANTFNMQIEAWLKYHEKTIFNSLTSKSLNNDVSCLLRDMAFALAGVFYYAGTIITYLRNNDNYDEHIVLPNCYVGGNASKLLNWASKGNFENNDALEKALIACMIRGMLQSHPVDKFDPQKIKNNMPRVYKTDRPKQEVAYGLVCKSNITMDMQEEEKAASSDSIMDDIFGYDEPSTSTSETDDSIVAGEVYSIDGETSKNSKISKSNFTDGASIIRVDSECPMFRDFVNIFNKSVKRMGYEEINFSESDYSNIVDTVNQRLSDKRRDAERNPDTVELEPLFIIVLARALEVLSKNKR